MRVYPVILVTLFLLCNCQTAKIDLDHAYKNGKLIASLERTPCYGKCPIYEIRVYENGIVLYNGKKFTEKEGCYYRRISKREVKGIQALFVSEGFSDLNNMYPSDIKSPSDLPSCIVRFYDNNNIAKVVTDKGKDTPEGLKRLEVMLDSLASPGKLHSCDK